MENPGYDHTINNESIQKPDTIVHLLQVYAIPILTYGLEILHPSRTELQTLEICYRKILKQKLSIPTNTADPAVYILAGAIPIESRIHKLTLGMYVNTFN
jgi:hypothetical protein